MEDDGDAFLYGSDNENEQANVNTTADAGKVTDAAASADTVLEVKDGVPSTTQLDTVENNTEGQGANDDNDGADVDDSDSDSDSDVEFIIGSLESKVNIPATQLKTTTEGEASAGAVADTTQVTTVPIFTKSTGLDINKVGLYNDIPVTQLSLDELKDKPWRLPGADISDYFNFGFDEISWRAYCAKNEKMRNDFNPGKVITELLAVGSIPPTLSQIMPNGASGSGSTPGSMPPPFMMGMPGFMGMPNMPNMPNMSNMPNMPNMPNMNMPNMNGMNGMNGMNNMNNMNNANNMNNMNNNSNIPNIPNIPNINSRTSSNTPDPTNTKLPHIPSALRDARDQADKDLEKGGNNQKKFKDRERDKDRDREGDRGGRHRRRR